MTSLAPAQVLVRAPNWAGDVVMATPAFRALRERFPDARITLQILPGLAPLLEGAPWFDAVRPVRAHGRGALAGALAVWADGRSARGERFDLGLCLPDSFSSALWMRAARVRHVVGYRRGGRGLLLHRAVPPLRDAAGARWVARERHVLGLIAAIGGDDRDTSLALFVTAEEAERAEAALSSRGVPTDAPLVALAPGASYGPAKCWPPGHFARLADRLGERGLTCVLVGAPAERSLAAQVVGAARRPLVDLVGELPLGALKPILRRARLLVCNDAGARHVAVAFGTPVVCMMGPTSLAKTNLNLERVRVLTEDVACRPCYHRVCPIDHRCMTRLSPSRVGEVAQALLS